MTLQVEIVMTELLFGSFLTIQVHVCHMFSIRSFWEFCIQRIKYNIEWQGEEL